MKKVLLILSRIPWPVDTGMKSLYSYWIRIMKEKMHLEVYLFFPALSFIDSLHFPSYIDGFSCGKKIGSIKKLLNILFLSFFGGAPMQTAIYYSKSNTKLLQQYVSEIKPDFVVFDMIRTSYYIKNLSLYGAKTIMNLSDLLSKRYEHQLNTKSFSNILGQNDDNGFISKLLKKRFIAKTALLIEIKKTSAFEIKCANLFDSIVFISNLETILYNSRTKKEVAKTVPIGVDVDYFGKTQSSFDSNVLTFLGNMFYSPNYYSVKMICEKLLPLIKSKFRMEFIGPVPEDLVEKFTKDNVVFLGKVKDVRTVIGKSSIFVSPIKYGTGIKTKIIEAFAMGKCVVTNNIGIEGINAESGRDVIVAQDMSDLADAIDCLFNDRDRLETISNNGKSIANKYYSYEAVESALIEILN